MTFLQSGILGLVEGFTEFLPISSTAHLILASAVLKIAQTDFLKSFEIIIQLGAILAIVVYYWKFLWHHKKIWPTLLVAFLPTAVIGLAVHSLVKKYLLGNTSVALWSLLIGGIVLIVFEVWHGEKKDGTSDIEKITYKQALCLGLFQSIAIIPGVSRSAATIVGGMLLGFRRRAIVDFSFMLAIPTMAAATALDLVKSAGTFSLAQADLLAVGFVVSFAAALFSVVWLLRYIRSHSFVSFGVYRILLALCFFIVR